MTECKKEQKSKRSAENVFYIQSFSLMEYTVIARCSVACCCCLYGENMTTAHAQ